MDEDRGSVRSVERALDILLCFTEQRELGLTEVSKQVGLHKSTVFRLLHTLEKKGFVVRDSDSERYRLGFRIWELAASMSDADDPLALVLPEMERLRDAVEETVSLYVRDGLERVRVQAVQSNQIIRRVAPIGQRLPLFVGASSKVLVAFSPPSVLEELLQSPKWPEHIDREAYRKALDDIRRKGYAMSFEEREEGVAAVSIPVFRPNGDLFAALTVSGPIQRMTKEKMEAMMPEILASGRRMEKMVR
ncbi:MAG: IclR family transcriptional regulator [Hydrogenibacillus sp.]|nr:IclR family transcriptional regulator [Hydrogenibacillus sp.]